MCYNSRDIEFFHGDYFFGLPCIFLYAVYFRCSSSSSSCQASSESQFIFGQELESRVTVNHVNYSTVSCHHRILFYYIVKFIPSIVISLVPLYKLSKLYPFTSYC